MLLVVASSVEVEGADVIRGVPTIDVGGVIGIDVVVTIIAVSVGDTVWFGSTSIPIERRGTLVTEAVTNSVLVDDDALDGSVVAVSNEVTGSVVMTAVVNVGEVGAGIAGPVGDTVWLGPMSTAIERSWMSVGTVSVEDVNDDEVVVVESVFAVGTSDVVTMSVVLVVAVFVDDTRLDESDDAVPDVVTISAVAAAVGDMIVERIIPSRSEVTVALVLVTTSDKTRSTASAVAVLAGRDAIKGLGLAELEAEVDGQGSAGACSPPSVTKVGGATREVRMASSKDVALGPVLEAKAVELGMAVEDAVEPTSVSEGVVKPDESVGDADEEAIATENVLLADESVSEEDDGVPNAASVNEEPVGNKSITEGDDPRSTGLSASHSIDSGRPTV